MGRKPQRRPCMWQRRHFSQLGEMLRQVTTAQETVAGRATMYDVVTSLAEMFEEDNEQFSRTKFLYQCGFTED